MQDNRRQCSWALSWDSYRAWVCEAVQTIAREQAGIWGRNLNSPPFLGRPARYVLYLGLATSEYLHDWETVPRQSGHLQECSFPLWRPGLVMPRPCHTDRSFRSGRNSERSKRVKESKFTFFLKCIRV